MGKGSYFYFGDDPEKDGRLAINSGIPFGWFKDDKNSKPCPPDISPSLIFDDWRNVKIEEF